MTYQINVYLNTTANPPVTCSPDTMAVSFGTQDVQWSMAAGQNGSISAITWGSGGDPFSVDPSASNNWTGTDDNSNTSGAGQMYSYTISVTYNNTTYSSDPEIENDPQPPPPPPAPGPEMVEPPTAANVRRHRRRHSISHAAKSDGNS